MAEGLKRILEPKYELVGMAENGRELVGKVRELHPDVVLLDISMPLLNGIDAARQIKKLVPDTKIVFLSMHTDGAYVKEAFRAGGSGYLLKRSAAEELVFAIEEVLRGQFYVTPGVARDMVGALIAGDEGSSRQPPRLKAPHLTPRQREVLQLVAEGKSIKEIATILDISIKTVEFHKSRIMEELDLHTTAELTKYAVAHGIAAL